MAAIINTNIQSLNAQRHLARSQGQLATSMQRLSSGLRINSAKDDAAGLAISERMTTQVRGMTVAMRNASDSISLAQTAEGALSSLGNNLQRIRELAVQSRNATNSDEDRAALDAEVQQLKSEITRIARDTAFNGTKLIDGSFSNMSFQVGANQGQTIDVAGIVNANIDQLGVWTSAPVPSSSVACGVVQGGAIANAAADYRFGVQIDGHDFFQTRVRQGDSAKPIITGEQLDMAWRNFASTQAGQEYKISGSFAMGTAVISRVDGSAIQIALQKTGGPANPEPEFGNAAFIGTHDNGTPGAAQQGFATLSVTDARNADNAILAMDAALSAINSARADLGAVQSRFETTVENLSVATENLNASKSRIMDADFAVETANLSRAQILQQAGTAMVAQANQSPQQVLALLQH